MTSRRKSTDYRAEMRKFMVHVGSILWRVPRTQNAYGGAGK